MTTTGATRISATATDGASNTEMGVPQGNDGHTGLSLDVSQSKMPLHR